MSQDVAGEAQAVSSDGSRLGVLDAARLSWRLMRSDFWPLWVVSFLANIIAGFSGPGVFVVGPPMAAGVFYVLGQRMQGRRVDVGQVFQGFSQRFKQSFMAGLIPYGAAVLAPLLWLPFHLLIIFGGMGLGAASGEKEAMPFVFFGAFCLDFAVYGLLMVAALATKALFVFAQCAVWDRPDSGWEAAKDSLRLVRDHPGAIVKLFLLFAPIGFAGLVAGYAMCIVGLFFTMPLVGLWYSGTVLYLYCSWTGRPVVEPAPAPGEPAASAVAPADILPPGQS
jgi:uncharacterized membrane protein